MFALKTEAAATACEAALGGCSQFEATSGPGRGREIHTVDPSAFGVRFLTAPPAAERRIEISYPEALQSACTAFAAVSEYR